MGYILIGAVGFAFLLGFDLFSMNSKSYIKYAFALIGIFAITFSSWQIVLNYSASTFSIWTRAALAVAAVIFFLLLVYSVFIEVGVKTYKAKNEFKLVTSGTYALTRHPGVSWFLLLYVSAWLLFQNQFLLYAGLIWTGVNILYVFIQERFIFIKIFDNYKEYQVSTPMIIPNYKSIKKCFNKTNWRIT